jgi:hypothetical protein
MDYTPSFSLIMTFAPKKGRKRGRKKDKSSFFFAFSPPHHSNSPTVKQTSYGALSAPKTNSLTL